MDFGEWRNLDILIKYIAKNNPSAPICLVGTSLGTHIVLRYLQSVGEGKLSYRYI